MVFPREIVHVIAGIGTGRLRLIGQIVNSLAFFLCLNRYLLNKNPKYIILMLCSLFVFFSLGFRMMFAALFVASAIMYFKLNGLSVKKLLGFMILILVLGVSLSRLPVVKNSIEQMAERQETDTYDNEDYIRLVQLAYYLEEHFNSNTERLFGSGQPGYYSSYGKMMLESPDSSREAHVLGGYKDWGLIGQSWVVGPITILIFLLMMGKCILVSWKLDLKYFYIAAWYIFLFLISANNMEVHRQGSLAYHALVFYMITILSQQNQMGNCLSTRKVCNR